MDGRLDTYDGWWAWRDDLFHRGGSSGGKVRTCWALATQPGVEGLITAGSRHSPQVNIVAGIAQHLGLPCRVHIPAGPGTREVFNATVAGAEVVRHRPGYNTVIVARAEEDAAARPGWALIPFGMECAEAVEQNAATAEALGLLLPPKRVVVPVGSGMTLAGLVRGLPAGWTVFGVRVGADPRRRLDKWAPGWEDRVVLHTYPSGYDSPLDGVSLPDGTRLDPHYEAKAAQYIAPGDLLWVVGLRGSLMEVMTSAP